MFLIQICLHNEGIRNTHTFLGFCIEYILAIVAASQKVYFRDVFELFRSQATMDACGGNPSPRTYCAAIGAVDGLQLSFFPHPLLYKLVFLILDSIAIIVLIIDQVAWTLRNHHRTRHIRFGSYHVGRWPEGKLKPHWVRCKKWFWRGLEIIYVVVNILYMVSLIKVIKAESFVQNRWSYGQIISMTVWGPVIVKLFDLVLCEHQPPSFHFCFLLGVTQLTASQRDHPRTVSASTLARHACASTTSSISEKELPSTMSLTSGGRCPGHRQFLHQGRSYRQNGRVARPRRPTTTWNGDMSGSKRRILTNDILRCKRNEHDEQC